MKKTSKYLFYSPLTEKVLTECPCITGGLRDCSLAEIFISVLERARGSGGVKLPPLRLMPKQQHEEC